MKRGATRGGARGIRLIEGELWGDVLCNHGSISRLSVGLERCPTEDRCSAFLAADRCVCVCVCVCVVQLFTSEVLDMIQFHLFWYLFELEAFTHRIPRGELMLFLNIICRPFLDAESTERLLRQQCRSPWC